MAKNKGTGSSGYPTETNGPTAPGQTQPPSGSQQNGQPNRVNNKKGPSAQNKGGANAR